MQTEDQKEKFERDFISYLTSSLGGDLKPEIAKKHVFLWGGSSLDAETVQLKKWPLLCTNFASVLL